LMRIMLLRGHGSRIHCIRIRAIESLRGRSTILQICASVLTRTCIPDCGTATAGIRQKEE
jgi:hypothetical protein